MKGNPIQYVLDEGYTIKKGWVDKKTCAEIDHEERTITINLHLLLADTLIHEFVHILLPLLKEYEVINHTAYLLEKRMTVKEIQGIGNEVLNLILCEKCALVH